jgi:hypothetical protein
MQVGVLGIDFETNAAQFTTAVRQMTTSVVGNSQQMAEAAGLVTKAFGLLGVGLSVGSFVALIRGSIDAADHLNDLSKSTGITVENLAGLKLLAKQTGTDLDGLAKGINRMSVEMGKDPEKFKALGITATSNKEAFQQFADIFNLLPDINQRNALAQAVFAKSWAELAPALSEGGQRIGEIIDKGAQLSASTKEMSAAADEFNDKMAELTGTGGLLNRQIAPLLPLLNFLADDMLEAQRKSSGLTDEFHPLAEAFRVLVILGGNVMFVLKGIGNDMGAMAAQVAALGRGDLSGFLEIGKMAKKDAEDARAAFDKWEQKVMSVGTAIAAVGDTSDAMSRRMAGAAAAGSAAAAARAAAFLKQAAAPDPYEKIITSINEKIAADKEELKLGRQLTDAEKFESKMRVELDSIKKGANETQKAAAILLLAELKGVDLKKQVLESELADAKRISAERQAIRNADYAASSAALLQNEIDANKAVDAQQKRIDGLKDEMAAELMAATGNITLAEATEKVTIARMEEDRAAKDIEGGAAWKAVQMEIDKRKELLGVLDQKQALQENLDLITKISDVGKSAWDTLWSTGTDKIKQLGQLLKTFILDMLWKLVAQKWMVSIGASVTGGAASAMTQGVSGAAGSSLFGSLGSAYSMGVSGSAAIGAGSSFASTVGGGLATDAMGATVAEGAASAGIQTGIGAGIQAGLAAVPVWGWIALAGLALYSAFGNSGGGPKTEGGYDPTGMGIGGLDIGGKTQGSQRGDVAQAQTISQGFGDSYAALNKQLGINMGDQLKAGIFYSMDNATGGTSLTQLQVKTANYDRSKRLGGIENVARGADALKAAIAEDTTRAMLAEVKANSSLSDQLKEILGPVNAYTSSLADIQTALTRATKATAERATLEDTLFNLTHSAADQLARTRERELAAIDPTNLALAGQIYAQQDLQAATAASTAAIDGIKAAVAGITTSVSDSIFQMQYGMGTNQDKYNMLDVKGKGIDSQMHSSNDITQIAQLGNQEIALLNQAWGLLSADQQKSTYGQFEDKLNSINDYVSGKGADALSVQAAQDEKTAATIATAVAAAIDKAMASSSKAITDAAANINSAANTPAQVTLDVNVTKAPGTEVSISSNSGY